MTIVVEMMDQRDRQPPHWIVLPGGNLGNDCAFGKAVRELQSLGFVSKIPRLAVVQAAGSAPFYDYWRAAGANGFHPVEHPETLATAIKIGDPVSWPKAMHEISVSDGVVE